jgi:hypothetical protein
VQGPDFGPPLIHTYIKGRTIILYHNLIFSRFKAIHELQLHSNKHYGPGIEYEVTDWLSVAPPVPTNPQTRYIDTDAVSFSVDIHKYMQMWARFTAHIIKKPP